MGLGVIISLCWISMIVRSFVTNVHVCNIYVFINFSKEETQVWITENG